MYVNHQIRNLIILSAMRKNGSVLLQRGISLIELIVFMMIISVAVSGVLLVMNNVNRHSADALLHKQALASAESLLEEIELQAFTKPVGGFAGPFTLANRASFDTVSDYNGFITAGIYSATTGALVPGLGAYGANVVITPTALGVIPAASSVLITVTITDPQNNPMRVSGYRTAY